MGKTHKEVNVSFQVKSVARTPWCYMLSMYDSFGSFSVKLYLCLTQFYISIKAEERETKPKVVLVDDFQLSIGLKFYF